MRLRRPDPWLLAWMAAGLALRVGVALLVEPQARLRGDENVYLAQSALLLWTGTLDTGVFVRPPLYFVFLAGMHGLANALDLPTRLVAGLVQCALGTGIAIPVYRSARRIAGLRAARIGVVFVMLDPTLVAYCHLLWPETLFALLVACLFDGVARIESRPAPVAAGLGLLAGAAILLKPVFGLFTLVLCVHWLVRPGWRRAFRLALVFGTAAALVVGPWVIRNQLRYGPRILLENQGPYNLWMGNRDVPPRLVLRAWQRLPDAVTRSEVALERGVERIASDPARFASLGLARALNLWGLEFFVVRHAIVGGYGSIDRETLLAIFWVVELGWVLTWLAAALGTPTASRDPTFRAILAYAAILTLLVFGLVGTTRFRVPFALLLAVAAGAGVDRLCSRGLRRPEWIALAIALGVLGWSAARPLFRTLAYGDWQRVEALRREDWRFFRY